MARGADSRGSLLSMGIEQNRINGCLLEWIGGGYRLAGWIGASDHAVTTEDEGTEDEPVRLLRLVQLACEHLGVDLGRQLWDGVEGQPLLHSTKPLICPPLAQVFCLASPLPRLRVGVACLTGRHLDPVMEAIHSSPSQVVAVYQMQAGSRPAQVAADLVRNRTQVVVVTGGYDSAGPGQTTGVGDLYQLMVQVQGLMDKRQEPLLIYAGNRWEAPESLPSPLERIVVDNVLPQPALVRLAPLARSLHKAYWDRCRRSPEISRLTQWTASATPIEGMDWGFTQLVRLWMEYQQLASLHGLYCGSGWWLHVWIRRTPGGADLQMRFTQPGQRPPGLEGWPPLQLVSGEWPTQLWPKPIPSWHDPLGLAPLVAAIGQMNPVAALQVLVQDIMRKVA